MVGYLHLIFSDIVTHLTIKHILTKFSGTWETQSTWLIYLYCVLVMQSYLKATYEVRVLVTCHWFVLNALQCAACSSSMVWQEGGSFCGVLRGGQSRCQSQFWLVQIWFQVSSTNSTTSSFGQYARGWANRDLMGYILPSLPPAQLCQRSRR